MKRGKFLKNGRKKMTENSINFYRNNKTLSNRQKAINLPPNYLSKDFPISTL
jgi:hypothetical protein